MARAESCGTVFGCGGYYTTETLLKNIMVKVGESITADLEACHGIRIISKTFKSCATEECTSTEDYINMLRRAIVLDNLGLPSLNVVILSGQTLEQDCGESDWSVEKKFKNCFCITSDDEVALLLLTATACSDQT